MAISIEQLEALFDGVRSMPGWDPNTPLAWRYFLTDRDPEKIEEVAAFLKQGGYAIVNIYPARGGAATCLQVERVERHTPESLFDRNKFFEAMAQEFGIDSYDGVDIGGPMPAPGSLGHVE